MDFGTREPLHAFEIHTIDAIGNEGGRTVTELAEWFYVTKGAVSQVVGKPDWEKVVTPVVNFASEQPGVDPDRMALLGISMGGYLAPRALAFEHRLKAGVANGGVWSVAKAVEDALGPAQVGWAESDPRKFDEAFQPLMAVPKVKWLDEVL